MAKRSRQREEMGQALLSLDERKIRACSKKYGIAAPENGIIFWAGVHKAITALREAPEEKKIVSRIWLYTHGFRETFG